ncbi:thioredoxin domain-containing protein [Agrococcus sp. Ld7]|uniref:thioredoxin domain-containing protein n=1 Tax=Agrococcus sp. Ld7 TaxID=649148 RepID=UPI00386780BB
MQHAAGTGEGDERHEHGLSGEREPDNRLGTATSDYLRLHADNPVDWREWGEAAFAEARERGVPVFASVGYATCHWCHVMARESFADPAIGALLRAGFVAVKVDREERPDVDAALMGAASAFTRSLGWPLSVFLTPDGLPFFAGTYFPPTARPGIAAFRDVLAAVDKAWREQPDAVAETGARVQEALRSASARAADRAPLPDAAEVRAVLATVAYQEDARFGGLGEGQKFPQPALMLALATADDDDESPLRALAGRLLDAAAGDDDVVAAGGYSSLRGRDGGFFRYATQRDWSVPHFERMLVDNAQLLRVASLLGRERIASGLVDFLAEVLRLPGGAFAIAEDAESLVDGERVEGGWHLPEHADARRERPPLDRLVVTSANGLAIEALAIRALRDGDERALALAETAAEHLLVQHAADPSRLVHARLDGERSLAAATAADAGCLASGLLALTAATGSVRWAIAARDILAAAPDPAGTAAQGPSLHLGPASDGDSPSGQAALAGALQSLFALTGEPAHLERATGLLDATLALRNPFAGASTLQVAMRLASPPRTIVLIGDPPPERQAALRREPGTLRATPEQAAALAAAGFTLLEGKATPGAYRCEDFVCALPERW